MRELTRRRRVLQKGDQKGLAAHLRQCGPSMSAAVLGSADVTAALRKVEGQPQAAALKQIMSQGRTGFVHRVRPLASAAGAPITGQLR